MAYPAYPSKCINLRPSRRPRTARGPQGPPSGFPSRSPHGRSSSLKVAAAEVSKLHLWRPRNNGEGSGAGRRGSCERFS